MRAYPFLVYWWLDLRRRIGGDYSFETINGGEATKNAHTVFAEEIALADQSEILDSVGRSVWSNEGPPSRQSGQDTPEMRGEDKEDKAAA
jgi:hypothetical protein